MPQLAPRPCAEPGCPEITHNRERLCDRHLSEHRRADDASRGTAAQRGYNHRWSRVRAIYLRDHPLCVECAKQGHIVQASTVDHIVPHRGDYDLMWDEGNFQSLCTYHHSFKTAKHDGAFANPETRG